MQKSKIFKRLSANATKEQKHRKIIKHMALVLNKNYLDFVFRTLAEYKEDKIYKRSYIPFK